MTEFSLAAAGDAIITRSLRAAADNETAAMFDPVRRADAGVVNLEVLLHDYDGPPAANSGGAYMRAAPAVADDLTWAGFDLFAAATNHAGDYSTRGMLDTLEALERRNIPSAGLGRNLRKAREPAYTDTPAGRVGLVAACSTIVSGTIAGRQRPDIRGRPGIAPLRLETALKVTESDLETVEDIADRVGALAERERRREEGYPIPSDHAEGFAFPTPSGDTLQFVPTEDGEQPRVERTVRDGDSEAYLNTVREATRQADWVVASIHSHEGDGGLINDDSVPTWLEELSRDAVDAGADAVVVHGPHVLRGVEVYDGAPVFYSLGDFVMGNETITKLPADIYERYDLDPLTSSPSDLFDERVFDEDGQRVGFLSKPEYWRTVLPVCQFGKDGLQRIECHPLSLGYEQERPDRGMPRPAEGDEVSAILENLAALSEPYGTEISIENGVGVVEVGE
jgi:poly-gamma-glutamate capsule biosynthesis protein CapA/YwtB (metallophosphatase superfamily)